LYQALPKDERIEEELAKGEIAVDPSKFGFVDRQELYIDHVESEHFEDLGKWNADADIIHKKMIEVSADELIAAKEAGRATEEDIEAVEAVEAVEEESEGAGDMFTGQPGWVIEIRGHHFHNSSSQVSLLNSDKSYVFKNLVMKILNKTDVTLPTLGDPKAQFSYSDIGIFKPTIVRTSERTPVWIEFDPAKTMRMGTGMGTGMAAGYGMGGYGQGVGLGLPGGGRPGTAIAGQVPESEEVKTVFKVDVYNFVVQMAWIPRTPQERLDARELRLAALAEKMSAEAEALGDGLEEEAGEFQSP
jgi:hypothetical protein